MLALKLPPPKQVSCLDALLCVLCILYVFLCVPYFYLGMYSANCFSQLRPSRLPRIVLCGDQMLNSRPSFASCFIVLFLRIVLHNISSCIVSFCCYVILFLLYFPHTFFFVSLYLVSLLLNFRHNPSDLSMILLEPLSSLIC